MQTELTVPINVYNVYIAPSALKIMHDLSRSMEIFECAALLKAPLDDLTTSRESAPIEDAKSLATRVDIITAPPENGKMAAPSVPVTHTSSYYGSEVEIDDNSVASMSDYGSEFDATEINEDTLLASTLDSITQNIPRSAERSSVFPSIEFEQGEFEDEDQYDLVTAHKPSLLRVARRDRRSARSAEKSRDAESLPARETLEVEYDERSRRAWSGALSSAPPSAGSTD